MRQRLDGVVFEALEIGRQAEASISRMNWLML
jgi:hypothetical protein